ncbi:MAG: protein kinase [Candidatus Hydrogenedens sp.]|jgi:serine/threonine protein kinase|nr:protein kinase [Candidatus Hydrogenedens sp.]
MYYKSNMIIKSLEQGRNVIDTDWKLKKWEGRDKLTCFELEDTRLQEPLSRIVYGATPDFYRMDDPLHMLSLKSQLEEAWLCASKNVAGLPECIDSFFFHNTDGNIPEDLRKTMPFCVYHYSDTALVHLWKDANIGAIQAYLKRVSYSVAFTMRALHDHGIAVRQVLPENLRLQRTTRTFILAEFFSLCRFGKHGNQFDPHKGHLVLEKQYCAPECFSTDILTPATDVFALGILLLRLMGAEITEPIQNERQVIEHLVAIEKKRKVKLSTDLIRTLKFALLSDPKKRTQTPDEFLTLLTGREIKKRPFQKHHSQKNKKSNYTTSRRSF